MRKKLTISVFTSSALMLQYSLLSKSEVRACKIKTRKKWNALMTGIVVVVVAAMGCGLWQYHSVRCWVTQPKSKCPSIRPSASHFVVSIKKALFDKSTFEMFNSAVFAMPQKPSGPFTGHTVAGYNSYTASKSVRSHRCCIRRERQTQSSTNPNENEKKFLLRNHCICMHAYTD